MLIALHKNARTTPAVRAEIAASDEPASILAQRFGITEQTVYKWKKRDVFADRSHTAHRLQTVLTPAQETVVVHLRRTLLLPLDDLLAVTREFICPHVSRSGLDRCLRRHGAGNLNALKPQEPAVAHKAFKSYEPGYVHMDVKYLPQMQDESSRRYLFVAIDRATRWVFVQLKSNKTAASAQAFLKALHKACPIRINKLLTDNGKEFTDRLFASKEREPSGNHEFDQLCRELGIEHRLTKPRTPRTNGMVERFNGRIADVLKTHRFNSREDMEETLLRYVALYNHQLPQSALKSSTPMQAMKDWYQTHPHLFHKRPYDRTGCDTYSSIGYLDVQLAGSVGCIYLYFSTLGELQGIAEKIVEYLLDALSIAKISRLQRIIDGQGKFNFCLCHQGFIDGCHLPDHRLEIESGHLDTHLTRLDLREIEDIIQQRQKRM